MVVFSSTEYVDLTQYASCAQSAEYWVQALQLYSSDKTSLEGGGWLTDSVVNAGQMLLKNAYPHVEGVQSPVLGETLGFTVPTSEFV